MGALALSILTTLGPWYCPEFARDDRTVGVRAEHAPYTRLEWPRSYRRTAVGRS